MTTQEVYDRSIKPLPAAERLRLAELILNDIPPQAVVDYSDEWSEEDLQDFTNAVAPISIGCWRKRRMIKPGDVVLADFVGAYSSMLLPAAVQPVGRLSDRNWQGVQVCLANAFGFTFLPLTAPQAVP